MSALPLWLWIVLACIAYIAIACVVARTLVHFAVEMEDALMGGVLWAVLSVVSIPMLLLMFLIYCLSGLRRKDRQLMEQGRR